VHRSIIHLGVFALFFTLFFSLLFFMVWFFQGLVQDFPYLSGDPSTIALIPAALFALIATYANIRRDTPFPLLAHGLLAVGFWAIILIGFTSIQNNPLVLRPLDTFLKTDHILQSDQSFLIFMGREGLRFDNVLAYNSQNPEPPHFRQYGPATLDRPNQKIILSSQPEPIDISQLRLQENQYFFPDFSWREILAVFQTINEDFHEIHQNRGDFFFWYTAIFSFFWSAVAVVFLFNNWPLVKWIWVIVYLRFGLFLYWAGRDWAGPLVTELTGKEELGNLMNPLFHLLCGLLLWSFWLLMKTSVYFKKRGKNA